MVPENVRFEDGVGRRLRNWMMELCDVHTILRFARGKNDKANTKGVWVYDMRANMDAFGKTKPLTVEDFEPFEKAFGKDPLGKSKRHDEGEEGRFRFYSRETIGARNDNSISLG